MNVPIFIFSVILCFSSSFGLYRIPLYNSQKNSIENEIKVFRKLRDPVSSKITVNLMKNEEADYYGTISLGNPEQTFKVLFATGFSYFWVQSKNCSWFKTACWDHNHYDSSKSASYWENGKPFCIDDLNGESSGIISQDTLKFGTVTITNQTFGEANNRPYLENYDGILGLGFPSRTFTGIPLLTSLISKGFLKENIFSLFLDKHTKENTAGKIIFDGWDENKFDLKSVNYIPLSDNTAWLFDLGYIHTDDGEQLCYACQGLVDTGTPLIIGHEDIVKKIHQKIGANIHGTEATVDCSKIDQLPPITFFINNRNYTIKGRDYVVERKHLIVFEKCMIGIVGSEKNKDKPWILGNIFLQQFYTIFDIGNKQIAFADLK